ncbi:M1 family metallopeptidase [Sulfidibacter corallicola]|uniref:M1 family metallopeptidase n=1 Tax=Sulfidibacter corallicola TaxID=2818388 RepID=A0A8A4TKC7_SULCO|nr:M1 family metallopeptidase [Sulfidibacter corallicola]QTD49937.1 M1 family metallopeptidase [Sulfidibacter corallicola]
MLSAALMAGGKHQPEDKFRQLEEILPTPNDYRTASGAPGHEYWQQRADYDINLVLDDTRQHISGEARVTYYNRSPDTLRYLWVQLDQNRFAADSDQRLAEPAPKLYKSHSKSIYLPDEEKVQVGSIRPYVAGREFHGGFDIKDVRDGEGRPLRHTIVKTMMRVDLPQPLKPGEQMSFEVVWDYPIVDQKDFRTRAGYEYFEEDGNYLYEIAQFFPRMAAYTDVNGWQHKQFLGRGEFTLEFGDYRVAITVPSDHVVAATGVLQNADEVLRPEWRRRLEKARTAKEPVMVITEAEATANESSRAKDTRTWVFEAKEVRDFAFASSRKFIWDAWGFKQENGETVMAMSYYPKEGNPLWERYSTHSIVHTLAVYNRYTLVYPYPVAISVNGPVYGMEYPMICFNGPRPEKDKTYGRRTKYGLISVIIHEVGHNYFPMIVNSDERQWTWMDEGLNTFVQFLAEKEWEDRYPSRRGEPRDIIEYMVSDAQVPIMTNSESLLQFGNNAYAKPATALNILRETILGRELFDFAFREYSRRWQFKRPMPADFFRTMEDASGVDLDWFWRGWFYSTDHVDLSIASVELYRNGSREPEVEGPLQRKDQEEEPLSVSEERNRNVPKRVEAYASLRDFYNDHDPFTPTPLQEEMFRERTEHFEPEELKLLEADLNYYMVTFENVGGLVMPVLLEITYADGEIEEQRIPAEIWRRNPERVTKLIATDREIKSFRIDPRWETADADVENNHYPRKPVPSRFRLFKKHKRNQMQEMQKQPPVSSDAGSGASDRP